MDEKIIRFNGVNSFKGRGMILLSDPSLNNNDVLESERDFEYGGLCGTDEGVLYEDSLYQLFESSMISVHHEDDQNGIIELEQFGNIYRFKTFMGTEGSTYESTHIDFRTCEMGAKVIVDDILNNFARIVDILEWEFQGYSFSFTMGGDGYLTLHYKRDPGDKDITLDIIEILKNEFYDTSNISISSSYRTNSTGESEKIDSNFDNTSIIRLCEIANIAGKLEADGVISTDGDMNDMFNNVYVPIHEEWVTGLDKGILNGYEEEGYVSAYAERRLIQTYEIDPNEKEMIHETNEIEKVRPHFGHDIELVVYGEDNVSLECNTCNEVIYSIDKE